jgi:hypothetical protein
MFLYLVCGFIACVAFSEAAVQRSSQSLSLSQPAASVEEKHFIANTYGFLRTSSDDVGKAAETVLGIETNLDDLSKELDREYGAWISKKEALVSENNALRNHIAHLQGSLQEQRSLHEEELRLQSELAAVQLEIKNFAMTRAHGQAAWNEENNAHTIENQRIEQQIQAKRHEQSQKASDAVAKFNSIKDQTRGLQQQIYTLNNEVLAMQATASTARVEHGKHQSLLLEQNGALEKEMKGLQSKVVVEAQLQQEIRSYEKQVAAQIDERVAQQRLTLQLQDQCTLKQTGLETQIKSVQSGLVQSKKEMQACQALDAENQKAQAILNQCLAEKRAR